MSLKNGLCYKCKRCEVTEKNGKLMNRCKVIGLLSSCLINTGAVAIIVTCKHYLEEDNILIQAHNLTLLERIAS